MAKKLKGDQVFTGQNLKSGDVVFLTSEGRWSSDLQKADIATDPNQLSELETKALKGISDNIVIDVYPIVVLRDETGQVIPEHIREKLRTSGPSIAYC